MKLAFFSTVVFGGEGHCDDWQAGFPESRVIPRHQQVFLSLLLCRGLPAPCPRLTAPPPPGLHSPRQAHQPSPGGDPDWAHWRETLGPHGLQLCTLHWGPGAENDSPGTDAKGHHTQVPGPGIPGLSPAGRAQGPRHALHPLQAHSLSSHPLTEPSLPRPGRGPPTAAALCPRGPCEWP